MGRVKGIKNKTSANKSHVMMLPPSERITFLANLIIDRIIEDQNNGLILYNQIKDK